MPDHERRSRFAIAAMLVFPLVGPATIALVISLPLAVLGLFTLGPGGLLYYLFLGAWWLPGLYALHGPPFLLTGLVVALGGLVIAQPTIVLALIATTLSFAAYFALWLFVPGGVETIAPDYANLWTGVRTSPGSILLDLFGTAGCWYVLCKIDLRASWALHGLDGSAQAGGLKRLASYAAIALGMVALALVVGRSSQNPEVAWKDCIDGGWDDRLRGCGVIAERTDETPERRATAYYRRGHAYDDANRDFARAMADYSEAIRLAPNLAEAYARRGLIHARRNETDAAIADLEAAVRLDPAVLKSSVQTHSVYRSLGRSYLKTGAFDRAIAAHTQEIAAAPHYADGYLHRAAVHLAKGDPDRASADFTEAVRLEPYRAEGYVGRGSIHVAKGDLDRALADFDEAIRRRPNVNLTSPAYSKRGLVLEMKGNPTEALAAFEKALALNPADPEARDGVERVRAALARPRGG